MNGFDSRIRYSEIDSIVTHRIWGYPIFFLFLYIMFEGTFVLGDYPMQGLEWLIIYEACYKYQRKMLRQSRMNLGYVTENRGNSNDCFGKILTIP